MPVINHMIEKCVGHLELQKIHVRVRQFIHNSTVIHLEQESYGLHPNNSFAALPNNGL